MTIMIEVIAGPQAGQLFDVRATPEPDMTELEVRETIADFFLKAGTEGCSVRATRSGGTPLVLGAEFLRNNTLAFH